MYNVQRGEGGHHVSCSCLAHNSGVGLDDVHQQCRDQDVKVRFSSALGLWLLQPNSLSPYLLPSGLYDGLLGVLLLGKCDEAIVPL